MLRRGEHLLHRALLDDLAVVHDADDVGDAPHDAEVVGDEQQAHAEPLADVGQQFEDLRLHRHVERGGRLVGDQQVGLVRKRHGDHHALALPAGQLVRIGAEPRLRHRGCRPGSGARRCARVPAGPRTPPCSIRISPICCSIVCSGLSEVIGSWKMIEMSLPRIARSSRSGSCSRSRPLKRICPDGMMRGRVGQQLHHRQRAHRFAGAGFADQRHALALVDPERDAVDRDRLVAALAEADGQVADVEQRLVGRVHRST